MSTRHARQIEDEPVEVSGEKASAQGPSTAEEYLQEVHALLDKTSSTWAQRVAAEGHSKFPDHPELERLCRLLTPQPARSVPNNGRKPRDSQKIFRWLDENESHYRGQWILVNEEGLVASAPTAEELLRKIDEIGLDKADKYNSLMHHVH
jgi:hypothetical protein